MNAGSGGGHGAPEAGLGDVVVVLLASTLAGLRDRLYLDGYHGASDLVADLVELADDYLARSHEPP